jgi:3-phytase
LVVRRLFLVLLSALLVSSCLGRRHRIKHPEYPNNFTSLTLVGQFSIPALTRFPPVVGLPFGGISGLTAASGGHEIYGISDAPLGGRIYGFTGAAPAGVLSMTTVSATAMTMATDDTHPDFEGITLLPDSTFAISTEGTDQAPRLPPSIDIYGRHGDFVRRLEAKFVPEKNGTATHGARGNAGFESITLTPDGSRLFTAAEVPLIQDGEPATIDAGGRTRILEYVAHHDTFEPAREYAYDLEPLGTMPFEAGFAMNGLVELLALDRTTLLALERGYAENKSNPSQGRNRVRLFKVNLAGATDVSSLESLKAQTDLLPAKKTLLVDLSQVNGLSAELGPSLDNFEGMAFGPRLADGRATLLVVSDDNFRESQRTWFLLFAIQ